jgi:dynein heavy chain 1
MQLLHLPQELNQLKIMNQKMPLSIHLRAQDVQNLFPIAVSLQESLRTFEYTEGRVGAKFAKLVAETRLTAQNQMMRGMAIQWKSDTHVEKYAKDLRKAVTDFDESVNDVMEKITEIDEFLEELQSCPLDQEILAKKIEDIQKIIDVFEIESYSNLQIWVDELDQKISGILTERLEQRIQLWIKEFTMTTDDPDAKRSIVEMTTMKIKMQNQQFTLEPPLAEIRAFLYTQLHSQVEIICGLQKVEAQRYGRYNRQDKKRDRTYNNLVKQMKTFSITQAYTELEKVLKQANGYFDIWKQYQALWDLQSAQIYDMLEDDVEKWTQLLNEIRQGRKTFDTSDDKKHFGAMIINYGGVKQEVNNKYDQWHKEILNKFGTKLKTTMRAFYQEIQGARRKLEGLSVDASDDVTIFVTEIQDIKRSVQGWEQSLERQKRGQKLLHSQRYQFPNDWLWIDIVEFEWNQSFQQILTKKVAMMESQIPALQSKIIQEEKACTAKIKEIEDEWEKNRPRSAEHTPKEALDQLNIIGQKITKANE